MCNYHIFTITLRCHGLVTVDGWGCYSWVTVERQSCRSDGWGHYVPIRDRFKLGVTLYRMVTRAGRLLSGMSPLLASWVELLTDVRSWKFINFFSTRTHSSANSHRYCDVLYSLWRNKWLRQSGLDYRSGKPIYIINVKNNFKTSCLLLILGGLETHTLFYN